MQTKEQQSCYRLGLTGPDVCPLLDYKCPKVDQSKIAIILRGDTDCPLIRKVPTLLGRITSAFK